MYVVLLGNKRHIRLLKLAIYMHVYLKYVYCMFVARVLFISSYKWRWLFGRTLINSIKPSVKKTSVMMEAACAIYTFLCS